jgi:hypothetical protein
MITQLERHSTYIYRQYNDDVKAYNAAVDETRRGMQEYRQKMCTQCEIDESKTTFPQKGTGLFSIDNPGKIVMKNGDEYWYYQRDDGSWFITGLFSSTNFDTFKEMLNNFLKDCTDKYCR